jgi:hypothetical protein
MFYPELSLFSERVTYGTRPFILSLYYVICLLAPCYVVAKVYKVLYICDTVPRCRAHVHMFTIIQFLRPGQTFIQFLRGLKHVYCIRGSNGLENSYQPIPRFVCSVEALKTSLGLCPRDLCFYTAYKSRELVNIHVHIVHHLQCVL